MDDERYSHLPIPSYEEAISSRPTSSHDYRGAEEVSDDAERQGLLGNSTYRPPTVGSPRSSEDSDLRLPEVVGDRGDEERRQIEELDYLDPSDEDSPRRRGMYHRARLRSNFSKHWNNFSATFSSIRLPSFRSFYSPVPAAEEPTTANETPSEPQSRLNQWLSGITPRNVFIPQQYRLSAPTFARLCGLFTIASVIYILFALDMMPGNARNMGARFDPESVRSFVQDHVGSDNIGNYLYHITSYDHVAGTEGDYFLASWMQENWLEEGGFDNVHMMDYHAYLNYPRSNGRSVKITKPENKKWRALLEEELVDPARQQTLAWHGHSRSGSAEGHLIFANGGSREDFQWLKDNGVETETAIALVRAYGTQPDRAMKIKAAEEAGCGAILIYSDPSDDGAVKGKTWPKGPWRPEDSLERGGVGLTSWVVGDPLTPGWASTENAKTLSREDNPGLPNIPSLPLSWRDAKILIQSLDGQGVKVPKDWVGGTEKGGRWYSGTKSKKSSPTVELKNVNDENKKQQIWNVHGIIEGLESPEKKVIVGNHRDSWCFGSVDPGSGSAVMMEVVNVFLDLRRLGWRPLRTIEFVSWDAEEYNLIGSTEYVEDHIRHLRDDGIAYLNVDVGVYGPNFRAAASPPWKKALMHVLNRVSDPHSNSTLRQIWDSNYNIIEGLGAGSDYVAFQDMAGMSSIDFGFEGKEHGYPYHSCYETFEWMQEFGDPDFKYHHTLAQVWALLILEIADRPLIPFDLGVYARAIHLYIKQLQQDAENEYSRQNDGSVLTPAKLSKEKGFDLKPLRNAANKLEKQAQTFHRFEDVWSSNVLGQGGLESTSFALQRLDYNNKLARFESDLLDLPWEENNGKKEKDRKYGIPGREQFKHVIHGPKLWNGYEAGYFPAVRDAMEAGEWKQAQEMVERAAQVLKRAGERLVE